MDIDKTRRQHHVAEIDQRSVARHIFHRSRGDFGNQPILHHQQRILDLFEWSVKSPGGKCSFHEGSSGAKTYPKPYVLFHTTLAIRGGFTLIMAGILGGGRLPQRHEGGPGRVTECYNFVASSNSYGRAAIPPAPLHKSGSGSAW